MTEVVVDQPGVDSYLPAKDMDYPEWMTEQGLRVLRTNYLLPGETPKGMYWRVASAAAKRLGKPQLGIRFFELMWRGWLCPATPVLTNMGTGRGLPISCYGISVEDSTHSILMKAHEQGMLSKGGGGIGIYIGKLREGGSDIKGGGKTHSVVSWCPVYESVMSSVSQAGVRRGAASVYLDANHGDAKEFLHMRRANQTNEGSRAELIHHALVFDDEFMNRVVRKEPEAISFFLEVVKTRIETGEPYLMFKDNANRQKGECYEKLGLEILTSQLCNEVFLFVDKDHSFVCCLSSMNAARWHEWSKDDRAVRDSIYFLDGVMQEFIEKIEAMEGEERQGYECALRFAKKSRALGLGVLGLHTLYQQENTSAGSFLSNNLNRAIFKHIDEQSLAATKELAEEYGEPEWCVGTGRRNTHMVACAPTVSNSIISGQVSPGIEPIPGNYYVKKTAQGYIPYRNLVLEKLLDELGYNTEEVWQSILEKGGSVQHLEFLTNEQKDVFKTAREIKQEVLIQQAADRQVYIDQGQSLNLFFFKDEDPTYILKCHIMAWKLGLKGLYYCKSEAAYKADLPSRANASAELKSDEDKYEVCEACSG